MKKLLFATTCLALSSTVSMAADMGVPYSKAPVMAAPAFSWTGCYVGAHVGAGTMLNTEGSSGLNGKGAIAGGQAGCNYQDGNWVFGLEGEGAWSNIKINNSDNFGAFDNFTSTFRNTADYTIAARAGITFDRTLIYGKGGWAWGQFKSDSSGICCSAGNFNTSTFTQSGTLDGFLVGAGIEHALTRNWTVKFEYDYIAFGSKALNQTGCSSNSTPICSSGTTTVAATKQIFKVGANYLFDFGGAPLVAKY
jgi:outer membrane immunogenic protein